MSKRSRRSRRKKRGSPVLIIILLLSLSALIYSGYQIAGYYLQEQQSNHATEKLIDAAISYPSESSDDSPWEPTGPDIQTDDDSQNTDEPSMPNETILSDSAPIDVDFQILQEQNPDIVAWLYSPDTVIHYPVLQSNDNSYYLKRLIDGSSNPAGSLFMDYQCSSNFSDSYSLIYGHNMKNNSMFGTLTDYQDQTYYDEHPVMYLLTPDAQYRLDLLAGYSTPAISETYQFPKSDEDTEALLDYALAHSTFTADPRISSVYSSEDHYLALSTCSYEYDEARYVLIGKLTLLKENT